MFKKLNYTEPAVLRGIVVAVVALAAAVGVTVPQAWQDQADQLIVAIGVVAPIVGAFWTRRAVTPAVPAPVEDDEVEDVPVGVGPIGTQVNYEDEA